MLEVLPEPPYLSGCCRPPPCCVSTGLSCPVSPPVTFPTKPDEREKQPNRILWASDGMDWPQFKSWEKGKETSGMKFSQGSSLIPEHEPRSLIFI